MSDWLPPKVNVPVDEDDERSIWRDGYWTDHLLRWLQQLHKLFPTQAGEINKLTAMQCAETMKMYEREYVAWCAVERMKKR